MRKPRNLVKRKLEDRKKEIKAYKANFKDEELLSPCFALGTALYFNNITYQYECR